MNQVKIITDSTNDLDPNLLKEKEVVVLPLSVNFSDEAFLDGVDITTEQLYQKVSEKNELPKTAAICVADFVQVFEKYVQEGYDVVFTGISKQMSRTYENAVLAANEVASDRIFVVDSMNLSTGIGLLVLKACKYRDAGDSAATIAQKLNEDNKRVLSQFVIDTMDYLHKGGRCSSLTKIVGTLLKFKPLIAVRDGKMHVAKKPHGKIKAGLDLMLQQLKDDSNRLDLDCIIVTHSMAYESRDYLVSQIKTFLPDVPLYTTLAGCVISSHCGPGTIGILYMVKPDSTSL